MPTTLRGSVKDARSDISKMATYILNSDASSTSQAVTSDQSISNNSANDGQVVETLTDATQGKSSTTVTSIQSNSANDGQIVETTEVTQDGSSETSSTATVPNKKESFVDPLIKACRRYNQGG